MKSLRRYIYKSEIGILEITGTEDGIISLGFAGECEGITGDGGDSCKADGCQDALGRQAGPASCREDVPDCLKECVKQLDEYFAGSRKEFDLKLIPEGTEFQKKVWSALTAIPYGKTSTYGDIAGATAGRNAARAVGSANHTNRIAIIIPCHRVVGSNGKLTGYAGGLWRKEWLLAHEKKNI